MPYRAPELFDVKTGKTLDESVDIWSLGCTLYAVAYGVSPFETDGSSIAMAVMSGRYRHPGGYSERLTKLIDALLVVDPAQRPDIQKVRQDGPYLTTGYRSYRGSYAPRVMYICYSTTKCRRGGVKDGRGYFRSKRFCC